jgi:regulatory protein
VVIRELKPSQRVSGRWLAALEDGSLLRVGEHEVVAFSLYAGKELTEEEAEALLASARRNGWKEKALDLLARKPMSRRELERKLEGWEADQEERTAICDRLEELGYLNDAAYAARVVRHYAAKGFGEKKLRDELYRRGVPRELWEDALRQDLDASGTLDALVAKKLAGKLLDRKELQKVSNALARRGYAWSEINDALRRYGAETGEWD